MTDKPTSELITDVVMWYRSLTKDFADVDLLLRTQREFAARLYDFANEVGRLYENRNQTEFQRKAAFASEKHKRLPPVSKSISQAEIEAEVAIEPLLDIEQKADSEYVAARLLLDHASDVLKAMTQHLSHLKAEKRAETYGVGSQHS